MKKAFKNVSSVLDKVEFERPEWKNFQGSVYEFGMLFKSECNPEFHFYFEESPLQGHRIPDSNYPQKKLNLFCNTTKSPWRNFIFQGIFVGKKPI